MYFNLNKTYKYICVKTRLREVITKERASLFLNIVQKRGGGVQPESKSVVVVFFLPILTLFRKLIAGRGEVVENVPKVVRHLSLNIG